MIALCCGCLHLLWLALFCNAAGAHESEGSDTCFPGTQLQACPTVTRFKQSRAPASVLLPLDNAGFETEERIGGR